MEAPDNRKEDLPSAFREHLGTVPEFHARHHEELSPARRLIENTGFFLGNPAYVVGSLVSVMLRIAWKPAAPGLGVDQWDGPPFFRLQGRIGLDAFVISTTC